MSGGRCLIEVSQYSFNRRFLLRNSGVKCKLFSKDVGTILDQVIAATLLAGLVFRTVHVVWIVPALMTFPAVGVRTVLSGMVCGFANVAPRSVAICFEVAK